MNIYKTKTSISTFFLVLFGAWILLVVPGCAFKQVSRTKNIIYLDADHVNNRPEQQLNVFAPKRPAALKEVLIFIHGGAWNSGKKSLYSFLGNRMARKNIVTVIIDYPKSPQAQFDEMALDAAKAAIWVKENIKKYGGNPAKIFIAGHSAGGHLAALIAVQNTYFERLGKVSPLKGLVLIDAAGLDMYGYLQEENFPDNNTYIQTFSNNPSTWKKASPLYHLHKNMPPMLIYKGGRTYPSIDVSNEKFVAALKNIGEPPAYTVLKRKKHVPMITQFLYSGNPRYKEIIQFMRREK